MHTTPVSLLERLSKAPDQADWQRFVQLYTPLLFFWVRRAGMGQHDAEDLVQDIFAVLLNSMPDFEYDERRSFRSWLRTVTLNKWRDRQRQASRRPMMGGLADMEPEAPPQLDFSEEEYRQMLLSRAMELIEPEFQPTTWRAFRETSLDGRPPQQVASELGISTNAVYVSRCRVVKRLHEELDGLLE